MSFSPLQKTVAILPKPFAALSLLGSSYIICIVLKEPKKRRSTKHQILLAMSVCDVLYSVALILGTLAVPAYVNDVVPTTYLARGNDQTCAAQAFFIQANLMVPIYNASLSLYYVVTVKYGWNDERMRKRVRMWFHIFPLSIGLGTAIASAILGLYGNAGWVCWIAPQHGVYRMAFFFGILWFVALSVIIPCMGLIYFHVRSQEAAAARWRQNGNRRESFALSQRVGWQGLFFCLSFVLTYTPITIARIVELATGEMKAPIMVLSMIFLPMQGFFNALVYFRPRFVKYQKEQRERNKIAVTDEEQI